VDPAAPHAPDDAPYDAVVIGAGPAGTIAALALARRNLRVALVESAPMPRDKVCGACLGALGQSVIHRLGASDALRRAGAAPITERELRCARHSATIPGGHMLTAPRSALDHELAREAQAAGATLLTQSRARIEPATMPDPRHRAVTLTSRAGTRSITARAVILAAGLNAHRLLPNARVRTNHASRIGLGATSPAPHDARLRMTFTKHGYLGRATTTDGRAVWGAAIDPAHLREHASPHAALAALLERAGADPGELPRDGWRGTPTLTRSLLTSEPRVYPAGDAAGYVEPVTGEGISWALASGARTAELIASAFTAKTTLAPAHHRREIATLLRWRKARCAVAARAARSQPAVRAAIALANKAPRTARRATQRLIGEHAAATA